MPSFSRRRFVATLSMSSLIAPALSRAAASGKRRFTLDLTPGAIGVSGDLPEIIRLARAHGFESVQPDGNYLRRQDEAGVKHVVESLENAGLKWGSAGLPVEFRRTEEVFRRDLEQLPPVAKALQQAGVTRVGTWLPPASNDLEYKANLEQHATRLREVSKILRDHGLRFGLEYVGTPSLRSRARFPFIHNLATARELIAAINVPGTGLILDSWHWWSSGDTAQDLATLKNEDVVAVDLNDAPAGVELADQQDNRRELPAATGVIPVATFLKGLLTMNYDGPVRAEPFNAPLNALDNEEACARTIAALRKAVSLIGD